MDELEWLENDMNECGMMRMRQEWDGCHRMTWKWYEWVWNDGNESRMRWMTVEWYEWQLNEVNDHRMIGMSLKWEEWPKNDMNESRMRWMTVEWYEWV